MVQELHAQAQAQNAQLEKEGLIKNGLIYTGAFMDGLYQSAKDLAGSVASLVTTLSSAQQALLDLQLNALGALISGNW